MRIGVLASAKSWYLADLQRAAGDQHKIEQVEFHQLHSSVTSQNISVSGSERGHPWDALLVRSMPAASLEQVIFRMDALAQLAAGGVIVLNPPRALEVAIDKYLTTCRLQSAGLLVPKTICCQTPAQAVAAFDELGRDVVLKPLFGGEGRGIARVNDAAVLERATSLIAQQGGVLYLQEFIPHEGYDIRVLVIGSEMHAMRRTNHTDWRTNLRRGASAQPETVTTEMRTMAERAAAAVGARIAGVDLLPSRDGQVYAIEVNAVPGWQGLAAALQIDIAARVLDYIASKAERHA